MDNHKSGGGDGVEVEKDSNALVIATIIGVLCLLIVGAFCFVQKQRESKGLNRLWLKTDAISSFENVPQGEQSLADQLLSPSQEDGESRAELVEGVNIAEVIGARQEGEEQTLRLGNDDILSSSVVMSQPPIDEDELDEV